MPDSQSRDPGFESPFTTVSKLGHFRSLHDDPVHLPDFFQNHLVIFVICSYFVYCRIAGL